MKTSSWFALASVSAFLLLTAGCASAPSEPPRAPQPAKSIDVAKFYTGRWYEIARTPMKITDGCVAGTTDYSRDHKGTLIDTDACRQGSPDGKVRIFAGPTTILDATTNAKVSVRYTVFGVFPASKTYWMLDRGDDYDWFIVADPAFDNLSLFTREPRPDKARVEVLAARAKALGYDVSKLEYPAQFPPGQH
jgi:apolipoprotein D and lipocalin family protein